MKRIASVCLGLLALTPSVASAYSLSESSSGATVRWQRPDIEIDLNLAGGPGELAAGRTRKAVEGAFRTWAAQLPAPMTLRAQLATGADAALSTVTDDHLNVVRWVMNEEDEDFQPDALATTFVTYSTRSGAIVDADIVINAARYTWTDDAELTCDNRYDLENVLAHEVGHLLGLGHAPEVHDSTMYPTAGPCETAKRDLDSDDIGGVRALYADAPIMLAAAAAEREAAPMSCAQSSITGNLGSGLGTVLLIAAAAWLATRRRGGAAATVMLGVAVAASSANASVLRHYSLDEMVDAAAVVTRAQVLSQTVVFERGRVYTDSTIAVLECWAGDCTSERLVVRQRGGELGDTTVIVSGIAPLAVGDDVVLFLRPTRSQRLTVVGLAQGRFKVVARSLALRDLRQITRVDATGKAREGTVDGFPMADLRARVKARSALKLERERLAHDPAGD